MKNLLSFAILAFTLFSCSNSDENRAIDPTKLTKVIFNPTTIQEKHWNFYTNGLLKEITEPDGTILQSFIYDSNNNLLSSIVIGNPDDSFNFTYDASNHITSINGQTVTYDAIANKYIIDYAYTDPEEYLDRTEISLNNYLLIINEKQFYISADGNFLFQGVTATYNNNNMTWFYDEVASEGNYNHDDKINPFKQALFPICRALGITNFRNANSKWTLGEYNSVNNVIFNDYDSEGTEDLSYIYEYNTNNLPFKRTANNYSGGTLEGSYLSAIYYYQGDIIP